MPTITDMETAIIGRLSDALPYLRTCGSLSEFLGRDIGAIEDLAPLCPAAFVIYARGKFSQKLSGLQDREMTFAVVAVVRNLRSETAVRHGSAAEKGVYELLEDVRTALCGQACGLEMDPLAPVSEQAVAGSRDFALYEILFRTRCRFGDGE